MLSVNQINGQIKLTEVWKAANVENYPIKLLKKDLNSVTMSTRAATRGDLVLQGKNELCTTSFLQDSARIWNNAPNDIKDCNSIYKAKKNIKKFVHTLPL